MIEGLDALAVILAGIAASTINTIVGSGSLITFPTLVALGLPPVTANVTNTVGLVAGSVSGTYGYRRELSGQRARLVRLGAASALGSVAGAALLLTLPAAAFDAVVPVLIIGACVLVVLQPRLNARMADRPRHPHGGPWVWLLVLAAGVYGGYFGAAQGVILMAILGLGLDESLQRVNAAKNFLALVVNVVGAVIFAFVADVDWRAAALLAVGTLVGGLLGARFGRRLSPTALRVIVVVIGVAAAVMFLVD